MRGLVVGSLCIAVATAAASLPLRMVVDGAGRRVIVPRRPARIVSMAPSVTEMLFALGGGDRVVGVTDFCDYPPEATARTHIGGMINPDLERIVSLAPDLVVASTSGNYRDAIEKIEALGIPAYTIDTPSVERILETLGTLGDLLDTSDTAGRLVARLRARLRSVRAAADGTARPRTLFVLESDPLIAAGPGTFLGEALEIAGAELATTASRSRWAQYDLEQVIRMKPEVILTTAANREWSRRILSADRWRGVPAVATGRVFVVSDAIQHPGPRLVDGIEEIARILKASP
ncbi:MAG: ABC transporter substrate-binding protein [Acidobacteriota bacterium]